MVRFPPILKFNLAVLTLLEILVNAITLNISAELAELKLRLFVMLNVQVPPAL